MAEDKKVTLKDAVEQEEFRQKMKWAGEELNHLLNKKIAELLKEETE